jgi:hypothetical protein
MSFFQTVTHQEKFLGTCQHGKALKFCFWHNHTNTNFYFRIPYVHTLLLIYTRWMRVEHGKALKFCFRHNRTNTNFYFWIPYVHTLLLIYTRWVRVQHGKALKFCFRHNRTNTNFYFRIPYVHTLLLIYAKWVRVLHLLEGVRRLQGFINFILDVCFFFQRMNMYLFKVVYV